MKKKIFLGALLCTLSAPALAGGWYEGFPQIGGPSYCTSYTNGNCVSTVPAGPSTITGAEVLGVDLSVNGTGMYGPFTGGVLGLPQIGTGALSDVTSPVTATIPANTPWYFVDGTQGSAYTITLPASPVDNGGA